MTIHIYGQRGPHDEVLIAGTLESLRRLVGVLIEVVLPRDGQAHRYSQEYAADGESYDLHVVAVPDAIADSLPAPYSDLCAAASPEELSALWQMVLERA